MGLALRILDQRAIGGMGEVVIGDLPVLRVEAFHIIGQHADQLVMDLFDGLFFRTAGINIRQELIHRGIEFGHLLFVIGIRAGHTDQDIVSAVLILLAGRHITEGGLDIVVQPEIFRMVIHEGIVDLVEIVHPRLGFGIDGRGEHQGQPVGSGILGDGLHDIIEGHFIRVQLFIVVIMFSLVDQQGAGIFLAVGESTGSFHDLLFLLRGDDLGAFDIGIEHEALSHGKVKGIILSLLCHFHSFRLCSSRFRLRSCFFSCFRLRGLFFDRFCLLGSYRRFRFFRRRLGRCTAAAS